MRLIVSPAALKTMARDMPQQDRDRLLQKTEVFAANPFATHASAAPLRGEPDLVRIRQGDWRGVALIVRDRDVVILERVGHRREVYR